MPGYLTDEMIMRTAAAATPASTTAPGMRGFSPVTVAPLVLKGLMLLDRGDDDHDDEYHDRRDHDHDSGADEERDR